MSFNNFSVGILNIVDSPNIKNKDLVGSGKGSMYDFKIVRKPKLKEFFGQYDFWGLFAILTKKSLSLIYYQL